VCVLWLQGSAIQYILRSSVFWACYKEPVTELKLPGNTGNRRVRRLESHILKAPAVVRLPAYAVAYQIGKRYCHHGNCANSPTFF
jgi:hypothetical protein